MDSSFIGTALEHYNIIAAAAALAAIAVATRIGHWLIFKNAALDDMRTLNREADKTKWEMDKYPPVVKANHKLGMWMNLAFFFLVLPFMVTLVVPPIGTLLLQVFVVLMVYDFFYYLSHRFWFHGNGWMRKIHAVHHQARNPTYLDAHYVHPFETFVGLGLYMGTIILLAPIFQPYSVVTIVVTFLIFTNINIINHTHVELDRFPFKTLTWITKKHHVHHENMHKGNYATITLLYDRIFGTLD
ncbi:MAG: sterol desaturase family protein [Pseudomonadota bacterium]